MHFLVYVYCPDKMSSFFRKAIAEYEKRLDRYCRIRLRVVRKEKEWRKILSEAEEGYYLTAGSSVSSEEFSRQIARWEGERVKEVIFYVDRQVGEDGQAGEEIPEKNLEIFSLSLFELSGSMATVILYEQIYRGYRILHNHPYHK